MKSLNYDEFMEVFKEYDAMARKTLDELKNANERDQVMNASLFTNVHTTLINKCIENYLSLEMKALKIFIKDLTTLKENQIAD